MVRILTDGVRGRRFDRTHHRRVPVRQDALENLFGFKFGVGASVTTNRRKDAIKDAVVNTEGVVAASRRQHDSSVGYCARGALLLRAGPPIPESHDRQLGDRAVRRHPAGRRWERPVGAGLWSHGRVPAAEHAPISSTNLSWNFGIGAIYDPSVKVLGNGIVVDRPLPVGEIGFARSRSGAGVSC